MRMTSKLNWNRLGFFLLGTFFGGTIFGFLGSIFRPRGR